MVNRKAASCAASASPVKLGRFSLNPPLIATETKPGGICSVWYPR